MNTIKTPSTVECSDMILLVRIFMSGLYEFEYSYYAFLIKVNFCFSREAQQRTCC